MALPSGRTKEGKARLCTELSARLFAVLGDRSSPQASASASVGSGYQGLGRRHAAPRMGLAGRSSSRQRSSPHQQRREDCAQPSRQGTFLTQMREVDPRTARCLECIYPTTVPSSVYFRGRRLDAVVPPHRGWSCSGIPGLQGSAISLPAVSLRLLWAWLLPLRTTACWQAPRMRLTRQCSLGVVTTSVGLEFSTLQRNPRNAASGFEMVTVRCCVRLRAMLPYARVSRVYRRAGRPIDCARPLDMVGQCEPTLTLLFGAYTRRSGAVSRSRIRPSSCESDVCRWPTIVLFSASKHCRQCAGSSAVTHDCRDASFDVRCDLWFGMKCIT